jgi:CrcB protein
MKHALLVFLGGGLGSALRYGFGKIFQTVPGAFPMSTFTVNILGCFLIGIFMGKSISINGRPLKKII